MAAMTAAAEVEVAEIIRGDARLSKGVTWRRILHAHVQRGKRDGGPVCVGNLKDYLFVGNVPQDGAACGARGLRRATLHLPNSFEKDDGLACATEGVAENDEEAIEAACEQAMVHLFLRDAAGNHPNSKLSLVAQNWKIPCTELLARVSAACGANWAAVLVRPRHPSARQRNPSRFPEPEDPHRREQEVLVLLRQICASEQGEVVNPARLRRQFHK